MTVLIYKLVHKFKRKQIVESKSIYVCKDIGTYGLVSASNCFFFIFGTHILHINDINYVLKWYKL